MDTLFTRAKPSWDSRVCKCGARYDHIAGPVCEVLQADTEPRKFKFVEGPFKGLICQVLRSSSNRATVLIRVCSVNSLTEVSCEDAFNWAKTDI